MGYFRPLERDTTCPCKWDVLLSPPFSNCSSSFGSFFQFWFHGYTFQVSFADVCNYVLFYRQTSKAIRMLDQLLNGHQDCCMWPSHLGCDYASIRTGMKVQACRQLMPFFGCTDLGNSALVRPICFIDSLVTILAAVAAGSRKSCKLNTAIQFSFVLVVETE